MAVFLFLIDFVNTFCSRLRNVVVLRGNHEDRYNISELTQLAGGKQYIYHCITVNYHDSQYFINIIFIMQVGEFNLYVFVNSQCVINLPEYSMFEIYFF